MADAAHGQFTGHVGENQEYVKKQLKNCLKEHFSAIILLSINHHHTDSQMLHFFMCVCMYFSFFLSFEYFSYIFQFIGFILFSFNLNKTVI